MADEKNRPPGLGSGWESARQTDLRGRTRTVIVSAVINSVRLFRRQNDAVIADVVVVAAKSNKGIFELRVRSIHDSYDISSVLRVDHLIVGVKLERQLHAIQRKRRQIFLLVRLCEE